VPSRRTVTAALLGLAVLPAPAAANPFSDRLGQRRLFVVFATESTRDRLDRQLALVASPKFSARDLDLIEAVGSGPVRVNRQPVASPTVDELRDHYRVAGDFAVRLVGKDGEVKLATTHLVTMEQLAEIIDAMPMRQGEMRERQDLGRVIDDRTDLA
jgi:hypothetical protein